MIKVKCVRCGKEIGIGENVLINLMCQGCSHQVVKFSEDVVVVCGICDSKKTIKAGKETDCFCQKQPDSPRHYLVRVKRRNIASKGVEVLKTVKKKRNPKKSK